MADGARLLPPLAHCEDARGVVAGAMEQAVEPALEGQGDALPLAQSEDASGVVAHAVQEVVDTARAGLLPAAVGQALPGSGQGAEQEQEQEAGSSPGLPEQRAALATGQRGGHCPAPALSPLLCSLGFQLPPALVVAAGAQPHTRGAPGASPCAALGHGQHPHLCPSQQPDVGVLTAPLPCSRTRQLRQTPSSR